MNNEDLTSLPFQKKKKTPLIPEQWNANKERKSNKTPPAANPLP